MSEIPVTDSLSRSSDGDQQKDCEVLNQLKAETSSAVNGLTSLQNTWSGFDTTMNNCLEELMLSTNMDQSTTWFGSTFLASPLRPMGVS